MFENEMYNIVNNEDIMNVKNMLDEASSIDENGNEYWSARDLMTLLGYSSWQRFEELINKSICSCESFGYNVEEHFDFNIDVKIKMGHGYKYVSDFKLSKYACNLICQNGDPSKKPIVGIAQSYFSIMSNALSDMIDTYQYSQREPVVTQTKYTDGEFNSTLYSHGVNNGNAVGRVKSKGDEALFGGYNTKQMKEKLGVSNNVSLNDCLHNLPLAFRQAAMQLSNQQILDRNISGENSISCIHSENNSAMRNIMVNNGYYPENFPVNENFKKLERRVNKINEIDPNSVSIATNIDTGEKVLVGVDMYGNQVVKCSPFTHIER